MKKSPKLWLIILMAVLCVCFAGVSCVQAMVGQGRVRENLDQSQLAIMNTREKIDEIQLKREEKAKASRQKKLDRKKKKEAQATPAPEETTEESAPVSTPEPEEEMEENINSFKTEENGYVVGIDPGHQGSWVDMSAPEPNGPGSSQTKARCTTGTTGNFTGLEEFQLNLDVSLKLRDILEERGYRVVMTREDNDANISNAQRAQLVAEEGADIYVRIHANSSEDTSVKGALTMCQSSSNPYVGNLYEDSYRLSETILASYCQATGIGSRGVMITDDMTGINWSTVPVTILEMGFMSNQGDDTAMADSEFQSVMAEGVADGIDAYFAQE